MTGKPAFTVRAFGEGGALAEFEAGKDAIGLALHMNRIAARLRAEHEDADCVAGVSSVALRADPLARPDREIAQILAQACRAAPYDARPEPERRLTLPVAYGGAHGPDLEDLCNALGLSQDAFIEAHASTVFRVLMIGFAPGFAYLGELPAHLRAPRKASPATRVPAGSIGVAANMTGVYPAQSPGGWRLIGRTPETLFDPHSENPLKIGAGDEVRFVPISADEFSRRRP